MKRVAMLCAAALVLASCGGEPPEEDDLMVSVGGHQLHIACEGSGAPAVVLDSGLGQAAADWRPIVERLSPHTRVCSYDRAGYGRSEPGPFPRDSRTVAHELKALIEAAGVPKPFVLVGHSIGALNAQIYADLFPEDLVGLVLLDPPPLEWISGAGFEGLRAMAEDMTAEWSRAADEAARAPGAEGVRQAAFLNTLASEHAEMFGKSAEQALEIESFGALPLVVVAAGVPNPAFGDEARSSQEFWIGKNRELARLSREGRFVLAEGCTHNMSADDPDLVVDVILSLMHTHARDASIEGDAR